MTQLDAPVPLRTNDKKLGVILVEQGLVTETQVAQALEEQRERQQHPNGRA